MVSHSRDEVYQMCSDTVIMHQGMIETLGKTKEIFDNPGTVNAARLTGCKNISRATKTGTHEVYASDWDYKTYFPGTDRDSIKSYPCRNPSTRNSPDNL